MRIARPTSVAIIGAGVSGLATARQLIAEGIECTIFERADSLGGVWAAGYADFGAQVQRELYEFPDYPLPPEAPDFTPGPMIREYLEKYARHFGAWDRIRFGTSVVELRRRDHDSDGWHVTTESHGARREEEFDVVVSAVGLYSSKPNMPRFEGQERFRGEVIHVSDVDASDRLAGRRVAVVGYGKSGTDVATLAAGVASETTLIFREAHWPVPAKLLGVLPFKWAMLSRLTSALIPAYYRTSRAEAVVHSVGKPLVWLWWRLVELLLIGQCRLGSRFGTRVSLVPKQPVEVDTFGEAVMLPRPEFYRLMRNGGIRPRHTEIASFDEAGVILENGERLDVDVVVMATGWKTDYSFFPEDVIDRIGFEDDGFYLYRQIVSPEFRDLFFVGSASTISSILTYSIQARWLADLLSGRMLLPPVPDMRDEVQQIKEWKRRWMPASKGRGARLLLHMLHYHDQLLTDMGADPRRKKGAFAPFKEVFAPYQPSDYREVVSGAWRSLGGAGTRSTEALAASS